MNIFETKLKGIDLTGVAKVQCFVAWFVGRGSLYRSEILNNLGNEPWLMSQEKRDKMQYQKFEPAFQDVP